MIFCNTRIAVDRVQSFLAQKGYACQALHGEIPQGKRMKTIQQFREGKAHILVATDVAARGIHVENLSLVINYDVPLEKDSYVHRIGRTARTGNQGRAISLVTSDDIMNLYGIEEHIGTLIAEKELPSEETYKRDSSGADEWIKAKAQKGGSARSESLSSTPKVNRKKPYSKSPQHKRKHRERSLEISKVSSPPTGNKTGIPSERSTPAQPVPSPSEVKSQSTPSQEIVPRQEVSTKKPLLQRVLGRLLGK